MDNDQLVCPKCRSAAHTVGYYLVTVSFSEWRAIFLLGVVIALIGTGLHFGWITTLGFVAVAAVPLYTQFSRKMTCESCGIHFNERSHAKIGQ